MLWGERRGQWHHRRCNQPMERPMPQPNDLSRSLVTLEQDATLIAVIEMSQSSWLVAGIVPGIERQPLKKLAADQRPAAAAASLAEGSEQGRTPIKRIAVAFEAGRDGFWLARWLRARGIEAHVIHASSVAVSREHTAGEDGSARHRAAQTRLSRLAARRTGPLHHGGDPDDRRERTPSGRAVSARAWSGNARASSTE